METDRCFFFFLFLKQTKSLDTKKKKTGHKTGQCCFISLTLALCSAMEGKSLREMHNYKKNHNIGVLFICSSFQKIAIQISPSYLTALYLLLYILIVSKIYSKNVD